MYCRNCGTLNDDNQEFCQNCNTKLKNEEVKVEEVKAEETKVEDVKVQEVKTEQNNNTSDIPTFSTGYSIFLIIFSVLCCGGIIGAVFAILSLVEGNKVKDYVDAGDLEKARKAKKESDKWIKATYITWAVVAVLMIIYLIFVFGISFLSYM